ncbi:MAG: aminopeptidase N [Pseudomonadota bacterium]
MTINTNNTIYLKDYKVPVYLIKETYLTFELDYQSQLSEKENYTLVTSKLHFQRNPENLSSINHLSLHGHDFDLLSIAINGIQLKQEQYEKTKQTLLLSNLDDDFILEIQTRLQPQKNTALEGLYKSSGNFCTQCEAEGFRRITYYLDQPDIMSVFTTKIIADKQKYPVLLSNGNPVKKGELENGKHYVIWLDPFKKPSYLFALVAGDLCKIADEYTTASGRQVALHLYVEHKNSDKCEHAMHSLKKAMLWDEQIYGLEYDLDIYMIVAVEDFNMGAMENKGLNVFNAKYVLARSDTATDKDYENIEAVIGHEYFHNWTGNRVTCRDWFQLSLKEGLTVFRDQEFTSDMHSRTVKRIEDAKLIRTYQFAEDSSPMAHPIRPSQYMEINNFYTVTVYNKGAEVIRMIETIIGKQNFRKGMDLYFKRHDGQAVTTEDFIASMSDASGINLEDFKNWYNQEGTPVVSVTSNYDVNQKIFHITLLQKNSKSPLALIDNINEAKDRLPFHIPLAIALLDNHGNELLSSTLQFKNKSSIFSFSDIEDKPILSVLRNFSAPVIIEMDQSDQELAFLMGYDSDSFNRWDSGQRLMSRIILSQVHKLQNGNKINFKTDLFKIFIKAYKKLLLDPDLDNALKALALTLPDQSYLMDQLDIADVDNIYLVRRRLQVQIAKKLQNELVMIYQQCKIDSEYQFNAIDIGKRSLRKTCMSLLMTLKQEQFFKLCYEDYLASNNMTDSIGALSILNQYKSVYRDKALADFELNWKDEPLVMDKWFSLQAISENPNCLDDIKKLMQHEIFDIKNPNRVRSLISAFAAQNYLNFHKIDGSGYYFIADQVIYLDKLNPQVASRLVKSFSRWKRFSKQRQELMKKQLQRVLEQPNLSGDVYEIVSKSLDS